jgi:hypothetical protein
VRVFLSFVSRDSEAAGRISRHLRAAGFDVVSGLTETPPGTHWPSEVLRAIKSCDAVVVLLSAASLASSSASFEISAAVASQDKAIIPVALEKGLDPPFFLRDILYLDLSNRRDWPSALDSLVRALRFSKEGWKRLDEGVREALAQEWRSLRLERAVQEVRSETREAVLRKSIGVFILVAGVLMAVLFSVVSEGTPAGLVFGATAALGALGVLLSVVEWAVESRSHQDQRSRDE